jgi:alkylation response protein AidB-like acyl-CoA dehydrogenase
VDFAFSEEQELLRASARDWLTDRYPIDRVVAIAESDTGHDPAAWPAIGQLGWLDPELGTLEHTVLFEETAHALLPAPYFSTVALALPAADSQLREAIAAGERSATLAWAEPGGPALLRDAARVATTGTGGTLTGTKTLVPDAAVVTDALVVAADGVYAVDLTEHPEVVVHRSTLDLTRRLGELRLDATPARKVADLDVLTHVRRTALAAAATEAVGVAQRALDLAAAHTKEREQFGKVIGTYQGVSHRVSNIFVALQLARSLAYWAAWCVAEGDPQVDDACAAAKAAAGEAAVVACENAIQVHGGVGFTYEHPLHRFYKRAQWLDAFEGGARTHRADIATTLLGGAAA